ncbi:AMP-binding protein [soil metagenome]
MVRRIMAIHFDPTSGSPYWLDRAATLEIDALRDIRTIDDLKAFGPMDESALATRPIEDFIPRSILFRRSELIVAETAGTLGRAKFCVHRRDEFQAAFVDPFVVAADEIDFPRGQNWLFVGPSGPHIIGKSAAACANAMGSPDPFTIDLDPRWAKKLSPGSFGWKRYLDHVNAQVMKILDSQKIGVLFSTPVVLESLATQLSEHQRHAIAGVHLGGVAVSPEQRELFTLAFPSAVILSGYGNSIFGVMPELAFSPEGGFVYYPHRQRLVVRMVPLDNSSANDRLQTNVPIGERGQVVISRLDESQLILNLMERDTAVRAAPLAAAAALGFTNDGVGDPRPIVNHAVKPAVGLY